MDKNEFPNVTTYINIQPGAQYQPQFHEGATNIQVQNVYTGTPSSGSSVRKTAKQKSPKPTSCTYRYKWAERQPARIITLYQHLLRAGFIAKDTDPEAFESLFMGEPSDVRIKWTAPQAWLWYMLREMERKAYITMDDSTSIWMVASSHFVDKDGRLYANTSFKGQKEPKRAVPALNRLVEILNAAVPVPKVNMMDDDPDAEIWSGIRDRGWEEG